MRIGIFSFRAFDRRLARLAAPISSGVRQGGRICPPPPAGRVRLNTPAGRGLTSHQMHKRKIHHFKIHPSHDLTAGHNDRPPMPACQLVWRQFSPHSTRRTMQRRDTGNAAGTSAPTPYPVADKRRPRLHRATRHRPLPPPAHVFWRFFRAPNVNTARLAY